MAPTLCLLPYGDPGPTFAVVSGPGVTTDAVDCSSAPLFVTTRPCPSMSSASP